MENLQLKGIIKVELIRDGKVIKSMESKNLFTILGRNHILDVVFGNSSPVTQVNPWYIGLIDNDPVPTPHPADTLASHTGWDEATGYTGNRKAWPDANADDGTKESSSVATFAMTDTAEIYGIFICAAASGTSGVLMSEGAFTDPIAVVNGDDFKVSYTIIATSA
jgi:hypothetical protein